jgi:hypothetical protein
MAARRNSGQGGAEEEGTKESKDNAETQECAEISQSRRAGINTEIAEAGARFEAQGKQRAQRRISDE